MKGVPSPYVKEVCEFSELAVNAADGIELSIYSSAMHVAFQTGSHISILANSLASHVLPCTFQHLTLNATDISRWCNPGQRLSHLSTFHDLPK